MCLSHLIYTVRPCPIHTCHAMPMPFFPRPRRETACRLPARVRLLPATTRSSTKIDIRSIIILLTTIHTYDCKEWWRQFGYFRLPSDFHEGHGTVGTRQGARHGMCELTARHGMGTAWTRHGHGMLCVNRPWEGPRTAQHQDYRLTVAEMNTDICLD